jgi:negative regulator of flagellin synthesis FlgM
VKIDSNKPASTPSSPTGAARARPGGQAGAASATQASPAQQQSTEAALSNLGNVASVIASSPVADADRVSEIKRAISEGRFQVNPERIADGLLQNVHDMLTAQSPDYAKS